MDALVLMLGLGSLCIGADSPYDNVRLMLGLVIAGPTSALGAVLVRTPTPRGSNRRPGFLTSGCSRMTS